MSSGLDIQYVQDMYQRMTNEELTRIATEDAAGLTPEAMNIVKQEIRRRGLDETILKGVEAQNKTYTVEEIDAYCDVLSKLKCPYCRRSSQRLNASMTAEVVSFIIFTQYNKKIRIGCPQCLDKENNNALIKSAFLGWWGIPWGIVHTIQSIAINFKSKTGNHSKENNDYLRGFALSRIGELEVYKSNPEKLE